jgi:hypothetical protein
MKLALHNYIYNESQVLANQSEFGLTIPCLLEKLYISITSPRETVIDMMANAKA